MNRIVRICPLCLILPLVIFGCSSTGGVKPGTSSELPSGGKETAAGKVPAKESAAVREKAAVYDKIEAAVAAGDTAKAVAAYENSTIRKNEDIPSQIMYANLLLAAGEIEAARNEFQSVLVKRPENADALYGMAIIAGYDGAVKKEQEFLLQAVKISPDHAPAQISLGELYLRNGKYADAKKAFRAGLAAEPGNPGALTGLGNVAVYEKEFQAADGYLTEAVKADPEYSFAWSIRGRVRNHLGNRQGAIDDMTKAISLEPGYYFNYIDRGRMYLEMFNRNAALEDFTRAIEIDSEYFLAYMYRGSLSENLGDYVRAKSDYLKVLESRPDYYLVYVPLAYILYFEGDFGKAVEYFRKAYNAEEYPEAKYPNALLAGVCMRLQGKKDTEIKEYLKPITDAISRNSIFYHIMRSYFEPSYDQLAVSKVNEIKDKVQKMQALFYLAVHYRSTGKVSLAQKYLMQIIDSDTMDYLELQMARRELERITGKPAPAP